MLLENTPYITVDEANDYFESSRLNADAWDQATESTRQKSLNMATMFIVAGFDFTETILEREENRDTATGWLRIGIGEMALHILKNPKIGDQLPLLAKGFSQASAGALSVTLDKKFQIELFPEMIRALIGKMGVDFALGSRGVTLTTGLTTF